MNKFTKNTTLKCAVVGVATSLVAFYGPTAFGATTSNGAGTTTQFAQTCASSSTSDMTKTVCTQGHATSTSQAGDVNIDKLHIHGHIVGEYIAKGGLTKEEIGDSLCYTSHDGYNSMRDSQGNIDAYHDTRPQKICHTGIGPSGYQVVKCGNFYWPKGKPPKRFKIVHHPVVVKSLDKYTLHGSVKTTDVSEAWAVSSASAVCTGSQGSGSGGAYARSNGVAVLRFTFKGLSQAQASGDKVVESHKLQLNIAAYAKVKTQASAQATSDASCTPGTTTTTPPTPVAPQIVDVTKLNDLYAGESSANFCATVNLPNGDAGTLYFVTDTGSFSPSSVPVKGSNQRGCSTVTAPKDSSSTSFKVSVKVIDNVTGLSASSDTQTVPVKQSSPTSYPA